MRYLILLIACLGLDILSLNAQNATGVIHGKVVDAVTKKSIEIADVVVMDTLDHTVAGGMVHDGLFRLEQIKKGRYGLTIFLVGYQPYHSELFDLGEGQILDMKQIEMNELENGLQEVEVVADKRQVVYKLDRQQISGSASLSASGGTAVDVLKSTPSIRIDADGEVSFRGSTGFLVYVDGKKSMLDGTQALAQIPAANIEDIEIITTPSARYRTDGDVGIIHIKTKKQRTQGFNGAVNLSGSTLGTYDGDMLFSYLTGKSRWYAGLQLADVKAKSDFSQQKTTIVDDYVTTSDANGVRHSNKMNYIGRLGYELAADRHNFQVEVQSGDTHNKRGGDMNYYENRKFKDEVINDNTYDSHDRYSLEKKLIQLSTDYAYKLNERGDRLSVNGRLRHDWYSLEYTESNMFDKQGVRYEGTRGYEREYHWDFDGTAAYEMNYRDQGKLELGYQMVSYSEIGDYNIKYWDRALTDFVWQEDLYTPFYYRRQMHSLYAMVNDAYGPVSFDAGLRGDYTLDRMCIDIPDASRNLKYFNLFPSAHVRYAMPHEQYLSFGYSHRANRPGIWKLEPYITYEDYYTKKIGNPDIKPEFVHSLELGYRKLFGQENSLALTTFYRHMDDVTDEIRVAYEPGVTLDSIMNAGDANTYGLELSMRVRTTPWWSITFNGSVFHYDFKSHYEGCSDAENTTYALAMINNFTLTPTTKLQLDANFVGPTVLTQGREDAYCYFDLAVRQQIVKNKLSASLVAHDIFRTACYDNYRKNAALLSVTHVKPKYPNLMLSVSWTFNASSVGGDKKSQPKAISTGSQFEGKDF